MDKTPPNKIYLQWNCEEHDSNWGNPEPGDITWAPESIFSDDEVYFRIPRELVERVRAAKDKYRPITDPKHGPSFWILRDLLAIFEAERAA